METVIWIVPIVVAVVVVYLVLRARPGGTPTTTQPIADGVTVKRPSADFHVVNDVARVVFDVPLPEGGADPVLRDLLLHQAAELMRDRKRRGQPLDGVETIRVFAKRGTAEDEVGRIDLTTASELPEIATPIPLARHVAEDHDPLRGLDDADIKTVVSAAESAARDQLAPVGSDLRLTAGVDAGLRSLGVDPGQMTATQLGLGLLELAGYTLNGRGESTYVASGGGTTTFVAFVDHESGTYPELETAAITEFLVGYANARTDRGLLITDKFGPYEIYEKERANPRCHFITRERLQGFVDSIALS
jgi:hypothetical protein